MNKSSELKTLDAMYKTVSLRLTGELSKPLPDAALIKDCRKQLLQLDKSIRTIQMSRDCSL